MLIKNWYLNFYVLKKSNKSKSTRNKNCNESENEKCNTEIKIPWLINRYNDTQCDICKQFFEGQIGLAIHHFNKHKT